MVCSWTANARPSLNLGIFLFTQFTISCWLRFLSLGGIRANLMKPVLADPLPVNPGEVMLTIYLFSGIESIRKLLTLSMNWSIASYEVPSGALMDNRKALRSSMGASSDCRFLPIKYIMEKQTATITKAIHLIFIKETREFR